MATKELMAIDTKDDRREIYQLICRLTPRRRLDFLRWCCQRARLPNSTIYPKVSRKTEELASLAERDDSANERLSLETLFDCYMITNNHHFNLDAALRRLVEMVRRQDGTQDHGRQFLISAR